MSHTTVCTGAPSAAMASRPASRCSCARLAMTMAAPSRANSVAMALPRPVPAPVTNTVVPSNVPAGNAAAPGGGGSGRPISCGTGSALREPRVGIHPLPLPVLERDHEEAARRLALRGVRVAEHAAGREARRLVERGDDRVARRRGTGGGDGVDAEPGRRPPDDGEEVQGLAGAAGLVELRHRLHRRAAALD